MILRDYKKVGEKRQDLTAIAEAGNAKIRQMQAEAQVILKPLQEGTIDQESDDFTARQKKLFQLENSIKTCKATSERDMKLQGVKIAVAVYEDLQSALKLFSEQNGYTLVLQIDREAAEAKDFRLLPKTIGQSIFYYRSREDITVAVLGYLNQRYETERAESGSDDSGAPVRPAVEPTRSIPASPNRKPSPR
jgi:Skp family chaperone for outer membrane proteins